MRKGKNFAESFKATVFDGEQLSWEQLQAIEKRRQSILKRQGNYSFFRIVLFWDGTLLKMLSTEPLLWLTMIIYIVVRVFAHLDTLPEVLNDIAGADIAVIGVFLSFFLVLFVNDANTTVATIYGISMECKQRVTDVASLAKTTLPRERALRLVRYMNAVHIAGYVGLSRVYTYSNFFTPINELYRLLTPEEIDRIEDIGMDKSEAAYREIITWCLYEISAAAEKDIISGFVSSKYREFIFKEQESFGKLYDDHDQPITFAYYHFICFLSAVFMPLFALSSALDAGVGGAAYWLTDIVAGLIVLLQGIFVVGLRVLAENMSDPFGSDVGNLSVLHYITSAWESSFQIILAKKPHHVDKNTEEKICLEHVPLGKPWETVDMHSRQRAAHYATAGFEVEPPLLKGSESTASESSYGGIPQRWSVDDDGTPKCLPKPSREHKIVSEHMTWREGMIETLLELRSPKSKGGDETDKDSQCL